MVFLPVIQQEEQEMVKKQVDGTFVLTQEEIETLRENARQSGAQTVMKDLQAAPATPASVPEKPAMTAPAVTVPTKQEKPTSAPTTPTHTIGSSLPVFNWQRLMPFMVFPLIGILALGLVGQVIPLLGTLAQQPVISQVIENVDLGNFGQKLIKIGADPIFDSIGKGMTSGQIVILIAFSLVTIFFILEPLERSIAQVSVGITFGLVLLGSIIQLHDHGIVNLDTNKVLIRISGSLVSLLLQLLIVSILSGIAKRDKSIPASWLWGFVISGVFFGVLGPIGQFLKLDGSTLYALPHAIKLMANANPNGIFSVVIWLLVSIVLIYLLVEQANKKDWGSLRTGPILTGVRYTIVLFGLPFWFSVLVMGVWIVANLTSYNNRPSNAPSTWKPVRTIEQNRWGFWTLPKQVCDIILYYLLWFVWAILTFGVI